MDAPTNATTPTIPVTFWFQGDLQAKNCSDLTVGVVDVKLADNESLAISAHLPKNNLRVSEAKQIEFSLRQKGKTTWNGKVTEISLPQKPQNTLDLKVDQLRSMTLIGGCFEPGKPFGPITLYRDGTRHQQQSVLRTDNKIKLSLPAILEDGVPHRLIVSSDNLKLSARLVPERECASDCLSEMSNLRISAAAATDSMAPGPVAHEIGKVSNRMLVQMAKMTLQFGMTLKVPESSLEELAETCLKEALQKLPSGKVGEMSLKLTQLPRLEDPTEKEKAKAALGRLELLLLNLDQQALQEMGIAFFDRAIAETNRDPLSMIAASLRSTYQETYDKSKAAYQRLGVI